MNDEAALDDQSNPAHRESLLATATRAANVVIAQFRAPAAPYRSADAFHKLYEHSHRSVYRYIYSLHGGPAQDVEDLTAETFVRAWNGRSRFHGDRDAAVGWLMTIARHLVVDAQRTRQRRGTARSLEGSVLDIPAAIDLEAEAECNERQTALLAALQSLPVHERDLLTLRYILGWQVKRIAALYQLSENTASVAIRRSLDRLRRAWPLQETEA